MYHRDRISDDELIELVKSEIDYVIAKYGFYEKIAAEDLDFLGEPPENEYITEKDLMIEL